MLTADTVTNSASSMVQRVVAMLELQHAMNTKVHSEWIEQRFEWYRAAWIECAELMDHLGYKWWKKQQSDEEQVRLEVIDIWHFALSSYFDPVSFDTTDLEGSIASLANDIAQQIAAANQEAVLHQQAFTDSDWSEAQKNAVRLATEHLAEASLAQKRVPVPEFWRLLTAAGLNLDTLYAAYVGKNVLNFFRQDHGYKDGSYKKLWQGREDNEHLSELVAALNADDANFKDRLYEALKERYANA